MNRLLIAALAVVACMPAIVRAAQAVDPVVPKGLSDAPMTAPTVLPDTPPPPRLVQNERRAHHDADARQCLNYPTNRQIHICAERYRTHLARARAAKALKTSASAESTKAEATKSASNAKPAETAKAPTVDAAKGTAAVKPASSAAKVPEAPKTSDVIKLPPLKPAAAEPPKPAAAPAKAPEPTKK